MIHPVALAIVLVFGCLFLFIIWMEERGQK
jgi:hypothetical protein